MNIRTKIILPIVLVAAIVLSVASFYSYFYNVESLVEAVAEHLDTTVSSRAHHIDTFLGDQKTKIELMASSAIFKKIFNDSSSDYEVNFENACKRVDKIVELDETIYELFILNKKGKIICSSSKENIGLDKSDDDYFTEGLKGAYIKDAYYSETTEKKSFAVSAPIMCETSGCLGVVVVV